MSFPRLGPFFCGVLALACTSEPPDPDPADAARCLEAGAAWEPVPVDRGPMSMMLDPALVRVPAGTQRASTDGDPSTVASHEVGSELLVSLDRRRWVTGLRYWPATGEPALTAVRIYVGDVVGCVDELVFEGSFDGSDAAQEAFFEGAAGRYVRVVFDGATDGRRAAVSDLGVVVEVGDPTPPSEFAVPGVRWSYRPELHSVAAHAPTLALRRGPEGMTIEDGALVWVPREDQAGTHDVTWAAEAGPSLYERSFVVSVATSRVVARSTGGSGGGSVTVAGSGSGLDGVTVVVPPEAGDGVEVAVHLLEGALPPVPEPFRPLGPAFRVELTPPSDVDVEVRFPLADLDGLPPEPHPDGLRLATAGERGRAHAHGAPLDVLMPWTGAEVRGLELVAPLRAPRPIARPTYAPDPVMYRRDGFAVGAFLPWPGAPVPSAIELGLDAMVDDLVRFRGAITSAGCAWRPDEQMVFVLNRASLGGSSGKVEPDSGWLAIAREQVLPYPGGSGGSERDRIARHIVAHELVHVAQWVMAGPGSFADAEDWAMEGSAVHMADLISNDEWRHLGPWTVGDVTRSGLQRSHPYRIVAYFKSVEAQRGGFNACDLFRDWATTGDSVRSMSNLLGGPDAHLDAYTTYVAAVDFLRTPDVLAAADVMFPSGDEPELVVEQSGYVAGTAHVWEHPATPHSSVTGYYPDGGGETRSGITIAVESPTDGFLARVYDAEHREVGELTPARPEIEAAGLRPPFYITVAADQERGATLLNDQFRVVIDSDACGDTPFTPCSGSGPAFDDECCGDMICVAGACVANEGQREGAACEADACAVGLRCAPVGMDDGARCCVRAGDYCGSKADCCGFMECTSNVCVAQAAGEACRIGDCEGASFCDAGTCTDASGSP